MISKPRRKRLTIESASARPICEGCKQSSSGPDGQENEGIQQLEGDWLCPRHLSEALDEGAFFNWLVRVLGLAQKSAGIHAYLPHQPFARLDRLRLVCRMRVGPQWTLFFHAIQDWRSLRDRQRCRGCYLVLHPGGLNMQASKTSWSRSGSLERKAHPRIWPKIAAK